MQSGDMAQTKPKRTFPARSSYTLRSNPSFGPSIHSGKLHSGNTQNKKSVQKVKEMQDILAPTKEHGQIRQISPVQDIEVSHAKKQKGMGETLSASQISRHSKTCDIARFKPTKNPEPKNSEAQNVVHTVKNIFRKAAAEETLPTDPAPIASWMTKGDSVASQILSDNIPNANAKNPKHQAVLRSKCSPKGIVKIMEIIKTNEELIKAVDDMGFGSLKYLPAVKLEFDFIKKLLDRFDVDSCSIFGVNIKAEDVGRIVGVPAEGKLIPTSISGADKDNFKPKFSKKSLKMLASKLKTLKEADMNFKETFMLYALGHFFCPSTREILSGKLYKAISVLPSAREYNWGQFILENLLEGIKDYQKRTKGANSKRRNIGISGCIYCLKVFFLQRMHPLAVESGKPVFSAWTHAKIKLALKEDLIERAKRAGPPERVGPPDITSTEHRLVALEQAVFHKNPSTSPLLNSTNEREKKEEGFEHRLAMLEQAVFSHQLSSSQLVNIKKGSKDVDPMARKVKGSLRPGSHVDADVIFLYARHLQRTMSSVAALKSLIQDSYSFAKLESEFKRVESKATLAKKLKFNQYSYILFPIFEDEHYSLAIVCFPDEEENSGPIVLHMDSMSFHSSKTIFQIIKWFLKQLWTNLNGANSDIPPVITQTVEVPQQTNTYDCAFFVLHMMKLFLEIAPIRFKMEDLKMFSKNWFEPEAASALRAEIWPIMEEELKTPLLLSKLPSRKQPEEPSQKNNEEAKEPIQTFDNSFCSTPFKQQPQPRDEKSPSAETQCSVGFPVNILVENMPHASASSAENDIDVFLADPPVKEGEQKLRSSARQKRLRSEAGPPVQEGGQKLRRSTRQMRLRSERLNHLSRRGDGSSEAV